MSWGKAIVLIFILFAGFIGTMVVRMSRQRIDLVCEDYYQDEIAYQQHIDRVGNTRRFDSTTYVYYRADRRHIELRLPDSLQQGTLILYRPADLRQDVRLTLSPITPAVRTLSMQGRPGGLWRAQLTWSDGQRAYYSERELILP